MIVQAEPLASRLNESYTFQSVSGKNTDFAQSIIGMPFYFRSCNLTSRNSLCVHAGGQITYTVPVRFTQTPLPYTLLLFITSGEGIIRIADEEFSVRANDCILLPSQGSWQFSTAHTPFSYHIFYLSGSPLDDYISLLCPESAYYKKGNTNTDNTIWRLLPTILHYLASDETSASLHLTTMFHVILSILLDMQQKESETVHIPKHVTRMKQIYDSDYQNQHPLEALENQLGVSRYRLCRDFSAHIGISPVQYLTKVRLLKARHLLLTTDLTIREVGISVGIENTTHFINLFKKNTGITPLQFRQTHRL